MPKSVMNSLQKNKLVRIFIFIVSPLIMLFKKTETSCSIHPQLPSGNFGSDKI